MSSTTSHQLSKTSRVTTLLLKILRLLSDKPLRHILILETPIQGNSCSTYGRMLQHDTVGIIHEVASSAKASNEKRCYRRVIQAQDWTSYPYRVSHFVSWVVVERQRYVASASRQQQCLLPYCASCRESRSSLDGLVFYPVANLSAGRGRSWSWCWIPGDCARQVSLVAASSQMEMRKCSEQACYS